MTKIDSRLRQQCSKLCNMVVGVLSLAPCYSEKIRTAGTSPGVPGDILGSYEELRWMEPHMSSPSPCKLKIIRNEEVLHLFRCYTHTPGIHAQILTCADMPGRIYNQTHTHTLRNASRYQQKVWSQRRLSFLFFLIPPKIFRDSGC